MPRRNRGVVIRHPLDFAISRAMAGYFHVNASSGNLSHVELFNNDKTGLWLYPYAIHTAGDSLTQFTLEAYQGQKATTLGVAGVDMLPLVYNGPVLSGVIGTFYSSTCVGAHIGQSGGPSGGQLGVLMFPYGAVPPGYSFCIECQSANLTINCGIWWMVDGAP